MTIAPKTVEGYCFYSLISRNLWLWLLVFFTIKFNKNQWLEKMYVTWTHLLLYIFITQKPFHFFFKTIHFKIYLRIIQLKILVVFSFKSLILFLKRKNYSLIFKFNLLDNLLEILPFFYKYNCSFYLAYFQNYINQ